MPVAQTFKFNFKSRSIKDESGREIGRTKKQPSVEVALPVLAADELIAILQDGGKEADLILSAASDIIYSAARQQFDELIEGFMEEDDVVDASMLDYDKLTLTYVASIPPSQRGATAITEDEWNTFFDDYLAVMVAATGKEQSRIKNHIIHFKRPQRAKGHKELLAVLIDQLDIYMASSANLDDTGACAARLHGKYSKWHAEPEKQVDFSML